MKKVVVITLAVVVVGFGTAYVFRAPLMDAMFERMTANMFVALDTDGYDPGAAVGEPLPALRARFRGEEITGIAPFLDEKGSILVVNRSVDW